MAGIKRTASDALWSKYVRTRDNWTCQSCGKKYSPDRAGGLHCSHYWSRGYYNVRFDEANTEALCFGCHQKLGSNPHDHKEHMVNKLGQEEYDKLLIRKNTSKHGIKKYYLSKEFRAEIKKKLEELDG